MPSSGELRVPPSLLLAISAWELETALIPLSALVEPASAPFRPVRVPRRRPALLLSRTCRIPEDEPSVIQNLDRQPRRANRQNRNKWVLRHLPLVRYVASRLCPPVSQAEVDDLISAGTIGLIEAADRYDPKRGVPFGSFAYSRIKGAVIDELSRLGVAGPGRSAPADTTLSLEAPFNHRPDATLMDVTVDPSVPEPQRSAELHELLAAMRDLPARDREMLGLSLAGHSGTDIADLFGCSQALVSRILVDARFRLEHRTQA